MSVIPSGVEGQKACMRDIENTNITTNLGRFNDLISVSFDSAQDDVQTRTSFYFMASIIISSGTAFDYVRTMIQANSIYLDHAAGTALLPQVKQALVGWLAEPLFNPSSIHAQGRKSAATLETARLDTARILGCKPSEIIFTSGGTEANNLAILGLAHAHIHKGRHLITCQTEHPSVLETFKQLEQQGFEVSYLQVNSNGQIDLAELQATLTETTTLISLMWVNNETGLIHPITEISKIARKNGILFHCDAVQALGHIPIQVDHLKLDALSCSGHKIGTPAGIGVLYLRKGTPLKGQNHGGDQEHNQRAGTQNTLGARSFALALGFHQANIQISHQHFEVLSTYLSQRLSTIPGIRINHKIEDHASHILNCSFHDVDGEALFIRLDMANMAVSNGSACSSGSQAPSHVLTAMGLKDSLAQASLRISLGLETTQSEIDLFCDELERIINSIKRDLK